MRLSKTKRKSATYRRIGGKTYKRNSCYYTSKNAENAAEKLRKYGFYARVISVGKQYCVYTRKR